MPTKRTATAQKAAPKAKAAKVEVDPIFEDVMPVVELLGQADLPASCKEMLEAMAPHCLKTPDPERSEDQKRMVEFLAEVSADIQARRTEAVAAAEARISEVEVEKVAAAEALEAAKKLKSEESEVKSAKDMELCTASEGVENAKTALEAETKKEQALGEEHKENVASKEQLELTVKEKWVPLKEGSIPNGQWRERNKSIDAALKPLQNIGLDGSLLSSLPVALKTKVELRGTFAQKALEHGEAAFNKQLAALEQKIANVDNEAVERAQAVAAAKATLEAAEGQREECSNNLSEAEKRLQELTGKHAEAQKTSKGLGPKAKELAKAFEAEKAQLENVLVLAAKLQELRERKPIEKLEPEVAPMEVEPAIADDTPAVVEVAA